MTTIAVTVYKAKLYVSAISLLQVITINTKATRSVG